VEVPAFRLAENLPLVIEIVDSEEKIDAYPPILDAMMTGGAGDLGEGAGGPLWPAQAVTAGLPGAWAIDNFGGDSHSRYGTIGDGVRRKTALGADDSS